MHKRAETSLKTAISPARPKNVPKYKGFCIDFRSSRRYSLSLHVEAPFDKNFQIFIFGFFPEPKMSVGDAQSAIPGVLK